MTFHAIIISVGILLTLSSELQIWGERQNWLFTSYFFLKKNYCEPESYFKIILAFQDCCEDYIRVIYVKCFAHTESTV